MNLPQLTYKALLLGKFIMSTRMQLRMYILDVDVDLHIVETLKENFTYSKRDHFYPLNQRRTLSRAAKFTKRARSEIRYIDFIRMTSFDGMMEWRN